MWADLKMKVKIFSTPSCPFCKMAKEFFKKAGIKFKEINVLEDPKAREDMLKKSGQMSVPVIEIIKSKTSEIIVGYDEKKLKKAVA